MEYASNDSVRNYRAIHGKQPLSIRLRLAKQLAASIAILRPKNGLHGDISTDNAFLNDKLGLKLGDFAGSSVDGEPALFGYQTTHALPRYSVISVESELFAFGSTLYEIIAGSSPYEGQSSASIEIAYQKNHFPNVNNLEALGASARAVGNDTTRALIMF